MKPSSELRNSLKQHLNWRKPRLDVFIQLLIALLQKQVMNLALLAPAIDSHSKPDSRYRRLQRFFKEVRFDYDAIAKFIMHQFDFDDNSYSLTLDRTNWQWGKININILMLGIAYKGVSIPIYWLPLNKKGNSNQKERIALIKRFVKYFGSENIQAILGDREFIGKKWWEYLTEASIPFIMRMRKNQYCWNKGKKVHVEALFHSLTVGEMRRLRKPRFVSGQMIYLSGIRLDTGELLILASNHYQHHAFDFYKKRWGIENLFQCMKTRGFNLEETRITHLKRIKKVIAVLAIVTCWAIKAGEWKQRNIKAIRIKTHGRPAQSIFRYGLDFLADILFCRKIDRQDDLRLWMLLICPLSWVLNPHLAEDLR